MEKGSNEEDFIFEDDKHDFPTDSLAVVGDIEEEEESDGYSERRNL
eukprot:gene11410-12439_t